MDGEPSSLKRPRRASIFSPAGSLRDLSPRIHMADRYRIVAKDGALHLEESGFFGKDLGELHETWGGKLETRNLLAGDYVLEDVSGLFSSGQKYRITLPDGTTGTLARGAFGDSYAFEAD